MRVVVCVLFILCLRQADFAGCPGARLSTNIGIDSGYNTTGTYTVYAFPNDSFLIEVRGSECWAIRSETISFNGQVIRLISSPFQTKLPCTPGVYCISVDNNDGGGYWTIQFIAKPKVADTTATVTQTTSLPTIKFLDPAFLFYPNPAKEEITLINETNEIRFVSLYNSSGHLLFKYEVNDIRTKIPLTDYPPGIYFMHVATLSNKIIIKKITVL